MVLAYLALIAIAYSIVAGYFASQALSRDLKADSRVVQRCLDSPFAPDREHRQLDIARHGVREDLVPALLDESPRAERWVHDSAMPIPVPNWISARIKSRGGAECTHRPDRRWWFGRIGPLKIGSGYLLLANEWTSFGEDRYQQITLSLFTNLGFLLVGAMGIVLLARCYVRRLLAEVHTRLNDLSESDKLAGVPSRSMVKLTSDEFGRLHEVLAEGRYRLLQECERRWQLERRKLKADKLAAIATLASSFAHEIGTPLGVIRGLAEMLMTGTFEGAEMTENLDIIITQSDEISRMVMLLLDIGKSHSAIRIASDVRTIVDSAIQSLKPEAARRGVEVTADLGPRPFMVDCDPDQLQRVFANIETNALEAMAPRGGQLRVNLVADEVDRKVRVSFEDTGPGVPTAIRDRIFDPFFTTKGTGQSYGIGLSVSEFVIADHDGELAVEQQEHGACFVVTLPSSRSPELQSCP